MKRTTTLICILWVGCTTLFAQTDDRVSRFKAVFIYNFVDYVQWPDEEERDRVKIGILGEPPLAQPLREIAKKRQVKGKTLQIDTYQSIENLNLETYQILFISRDQIENLEQIEQHTRAQNLLIITDTPGLTNRGVGINFVLRNGKLKFEINRQALEGAGLRASAQLLKLAILRDEDHP